MFSPALRLATRSLSTRSTSLLPSRAATAIPRSPSVNAVRTIIIKKYTKDHEYVEFDDATNVSKVFITEYAQKALGDVVFVELPKVGAEIKSGEEIGAVESVKAASDIYAPLGGIIESVNESLDSQPSLLNKSPEKDGWLCTIKVADPSELDELLTPEAYKEHCEE